MKIAIIKYNAGNIMSVEYAMQRLGIEAEVTPDKEKILSAEKVIFPGVGEASTTMAYLKKHKLDELIRSLKQPVLGICLGMQLMCRHSEENDVDCLGIFEEDVVRFVPEPGMENITKFRIWAGTKFSILIQPCSILLLKISLCILYIAIMPQKESIRLRYAIILLLSLQLCIKIIFMQHSFTRRKAVL